MIRNTKISSVQLGFFIIGIIFSDFAILNSARAAKNDAWFAFLIGMLIGLLIITLYILIAKLNPQKTLVKILKDCFGKYLGTILSLLYVWYFIHIASLVLRSFGEYMSTVNYTETPLTFLLACFIIFIVYVLRKGIEVTSRVLEIAIPILIISVIVVSILLIQQFDFSFLTPFLKDGLSPVLKTGFGIATFPFGESIILLMIFPYLNEQNKLAKTTYISVIVASLLLLTIVIRDLLILGPNLLSMIVFPPSTTTDLLPSLVAKPLISINLLIGGGCLVVAYLHGTVLAIGQLFNIDEDRILIIPVSAIIVGVAIWIYDSLPEMFRVAKEVYSYYAIPFQIIIPLLILIISFIKNRKNKKSSQNEVQA